MNDKLVKDTTGHYSGPNAQTYSSGCSNSCADYPTLSAAITACDAIPTQCYAITLTHKDVGGANSKGAIDGSWGYQLRASNGLTKSPSDEVTWLRATPVPAAATT
jgi:hypothetical protein